MSDVYLEDETLASKPYFILSRAWWWVWGVLFIARPITPIERMSIKRVKNLQEEVARLKDVHEERLLNLDLITAEKITLLEDRLKKTENELAVRSKDLAKAIEEKEAVAAGSELLAETIERYKNFEASKSVMYRRRAGLDQPKDVA